MAKILIDFSGWVSVDAEDVKFVYIGQDERPNIDGVAYLNLSVAERSEYILESIIQAQHVSVDGTTEIENIEEDLD